jgi:sugar/nucleoside kinase (ribokinase family)
MSILAVGTIGIDTVETPFGRAENVLGGSLSYFAVAASFFAPVNLVSVVGTDFPEQLWARLRRPGIDLRGIVVREGKTFRWSGRYDYDLNVVETLETQLNTFADFRPVLPDGYDRSRFVFLANGDPDIQFEVVQQVPGARLRVMDTMDYWIRNKPESLVRTIEQVDILLMNESEARMLVETPSLQTAAKRLLRLGPKAVIIKKGEYGAVMFTDFDYFAVPAYPLDDVRDPTGAGDSFAGGFLGYLARSNRVNLDTIRRAVVMGTVVASFTVEDFSINRLEKVTPEEIRLRTEELREFTRFVLD